MISNAFSAEYGRMANGVINFITKSGTNDLHGSLFEYFRKTDLNARQFFSPRGHRAAEQFRWHSGRPGVDPKLYNGRNKAFFFFSYEKALSTSGSPSGFTSVPTRRHA